MISQDDFDSWRDHPVTQAVFRVAAIRIEEAQQSWIAHSWDSGQLGENSAAFLAAQRAVAATYYRIVDMTHEELETLLESE